MDKEALRLECLRLAAELLGPCTASEAVGAAQNLFSWVVGAERAEHERP